MTKQIIGTVQTASDGKAVLSYDVPSNAETGEYTLSASLAENDYYESNEATSTLYIRYPTTTTLARVTGSVGETVTLTATIVNNTNPVASGSVQFYIQYNGTWNPIGNPASVSNGTATTTFNITSSTTTTFANPIKAEYIRNSTYEASTGTNELYVADELAITMQNVLANRGTTVTIPFVVTAQSSSSLSNLNATVSCNGVSKTISDLSQYTSSGSTITFDVPSTWAAGEYTIHAVTQATEDYDAVDSTATITVRRKTTITAISLSGNAGETINIGGVITDEFGANVTSGSFTVTIAGTTTTTTVGSSTTNTIEYLIPSNSTEGSDITYAVQYVGEGVVAYESSTTATGTIHVRKSSHISLSNYEVLTGDAVSLEATVTETDDTTPVTSGSVTFSLE